MRAMMMAGHNDRGSQPEVLSEKETDHELAHRVASEAASLLVGLQDQGLAQGVQGWRLEDVGDSTAHDYIVDALKTARPDDGLLSEEGDDDGSRTKHRRAWIVDPLDGSSGFGFGNREWAVHIALAVDGAPTVGAVAVPGMALIGSTSIVPEVPEMGDRKPVIVTGRTRANYDGILVSRALGADAFACSSAGVKAMLVMDGKADVYVHSGPLNEWDACAPVAVALAAGLDACSVTGDALEFNKRRAVVDSLLICRPELTQAVIDAF